MFDFLHTRGFAFPFVGPIARGKSSLYEQTVRGPRGEHEGPRFNLNTPRPRNHGPDAVSRARRAPRPVLTARVTARTSTLPARLFHGARRVPHLGQSTRTMSVPVSTAVEVTGNPAEYKSGEMNSMAGDGTRKVAFITGTTGQDGSYLVELLLSKGTILLTSLADLAKIAPRSRRERRRPRSTHLTSPSGVNTTCVHDRDGRSPPPRRASDLLRPLFPVSGYIVHGIKRRSSSYNHPRLEHIMEEGTFAHQRLFGAIASPRGPLVVSGARAGSGSRRRPRRSARHSSASHRLTRVPSTHPSP